MECVGKWGMCSSRVWLRSMIRAARRLLRRLDTSIVLVLLGGGEIAWFPAVGDAFARQQDANASVGAVEGAIGGRISYLVLRSQLMTNCFHRIGNFDQSLRGKCPGLGAQSLILGCIPNLAVG